MAVTINIPYSEDYKQQDVILDNKTWVFIYLWLTDKEYWSLSIYDKEYTLAEGIENVRIVQGTDILDKFRYRKVPQGNLIVVDYQDSFLRIGKEDFKNKLELTYYYPGEVT